MWVCAYRVLLAAVDEVELDKRQTFETRENDIRSECGKCAAIRFAGASAAAQSSRAVPNNTNHPRNMISPQENGKGHIKLLLVAFAAWKLLLLTLAAFCPGPGYDTSSLILVDPSATRHNNLTNLSRLDRLTLNLFRWDALYIVKAAERGKLHEQEWAFSWAYSRVLGLVGQRK